MKLKSLRFLALLTVCLQLFSPSGNCSSIIDFASNLSDSPTDLTSEVEISVQPLENKDFQNFDYKSNLKSDIKLPYTASAIWMRFYFRNSQPVPVERMLYLTSALTGFLELHTSKSSEILAVSGSSIPLQLRAYQTRLPSFKITLPPGASETVYIRRVSHHNLASKIYLGTWTALTNEESKSKAILFFYFGGIVCLILYNLFVGLYAKDLNYFLYAFFTTALASASLNTQGFFDAFVLTDSNFTLSHFLMMFSSLGILSCLLFVYRFLNISQVLPKARYGFWIVGVSGLITLVVGAFPVSKMQLFFGHMVDATIVSLLIYLIGCGVLALRKGYKLAQFFLLSWVSLFVGVMGWFGMTYGLFENTPLTSYALLFGNMGEMLILSLGLAYKIAILDQEKKQALVQAQEKEKYHRLVKVLSHDVANAISILAGYLSILKRSVKGEIEIRTLMKLDGVLGNMNGMLGSVRKEEILTAFKFAVTLRSVDLVEVLHEVVSYYEDRTQEKNIQIRLQLPEKCLVLADKTALINQVISNLLSNAVKFSYPDSEIAITLTDQHQFHVLKIEDHGVGIPSESISKIFFSKEVVSQSGTKREKGSGLGISLVKDYMEIFKGILEVQSVHKSISEKSGTSVSLLFPKC